MCPSDILLQPFSTAGASELLVLVDQHAAHERIRLEQFQKGDQIYHSVGNPMYAPITVDLTGCNAISL